MWQHLLFGIDPNQLIDTTLQRIDSAATGTDVSFPDSAGTVTVVPPNEAWIIHGFSFSQSFGATTARKLTAQVFGPVASDGLPIFDQTVNADTFALINRPLLLPPGYRITCFRNGADALSRISIYVWWQRVSLPAKRAVDKTRTPSPRRLDEIFMLTEG